MTPTCFSQTIPLVRLTLLTMSLGGQAYAQGITVDGRLSPAQTLVGPNFAIGAGLGRQVGGNLFHSFGAFGLKQGETATFSGPSSVGNVIGRVTGGAASSIDGGIRSTMPGANLYLVNPAGVVFGPNASVDVGGSFHASSADYLRMKDGARFQATNPDASTLSAAPPEAFGFLSASPHPVTVNGSQLTVTPHSTLGLVGGAVTISGGVLSAPGGAVHVASAAGPGEVPVDPRAGPAPTVARSGRVQVADKSFIRASGENGGNGGSVFIRAGELSVSASDIGANNGGSGPGGVVSLHGDRAVAISNKATVRADATGSGHGPDLVISTAAGGTVALDTATVRTVAFAAGDSGTVTINTGTLTLRNGAVVQSEAQDRGNGGPVSVAADSVLLDGKGTSFLSRTFGTGLAGAGGSISLSGGALTVQNGASVESTTFGTGAGGPISVAMAGNVAVATGGQILSTSTQDGTAGTVAVAAHDITIQGGQIKYDATNGTPGNTVTVAAAGDLVLDAREPGSSSSISSTVVGKQTAGSVLVSAAGNITMLANSSIQAATPATNTGGAVTVTAQGNLTLDGNGSAAVPRIATVGVGPGAPDSGSAGTLGINAANITLVNGRFVATSDLTVTARGALALSQQSYIAANSSDSSNASTIRITAGGLTLSKGSYIQDNAYSSGSGGEILVNVAGNVSVNGTVAEGASSISADSQNSGNAGNVTVSAGTVTLGYGGSISSQTYASGKAGEVAVNVGGAFTLDGGNVSSGAVAGSSGPAGTVRVSAGSLSLLNGGAITSGTFASGKAGNVAVNVEGALVLDGGGRFAGSSVNSEAADTSSGAAGTVEVSAGNLSVFNGATISSSTRGAGRGGSVLVTTPGALLLDGKGVTSTAITAGAYGAQSSDAGAVTVNAGTVTIQGGAQIANSTRGLGRGGGVTVTAGALTLLGGGSIVSQTYASGNAGEITLAVEGALTLDGGSASSQSTTGSSGPAGTVRVSAGSLSLLNGAAISSDTFASGKAGEVVVNVKGAFTLNGTGAGNYDRSVSSAANAGSSGAAGTVQVSAGSLSILNGATISSSTRGTGRGGSVLVTTPGALLLDGKGVNSTAITAGAYAQDSGDAGTVTVNAGTVTIQGGAQIANSTVGLGGGGGVAVTTDALVLRGSEIISATNGSGNAGDIVLHVGGAFAIDGGIVSSEAVQKSSGPAGTVRVNAGSLSILNGGAISSSTRASGNAGGVTLNVEGPLALVGSEGGGSFSSVASEATQESSGSAGPVRVSAGSVSMLNRSLISSAARGTGAGGSVLVTTPGALLLDGQGVAGAGITAGAYGAQSGDAGAVTVRAGTVTVQGGAQIASSTAGPGQGGDVGVTAGSAIRLSGPGPQITATATGAGNAGSIAMSAPQVFLRDGASVSTAAQAANGGNITVGPGDLLYLQRSAITTSVNGALGNGGNITVEPQLVVLDRSTIQANAVGGNGGNVQVRANQFVPSFDSAITASSQRGVSGEILVAAQPLNLNGSLVVLASDLRSAAALLREGCAVRGAGPRSSLVAAGRGGQRQGLEATLPALYFAHRPVRDGAPLAASAPVAAQRISLGLSSTCG